MKAFDYSNYDCIVSIDFGTTYSGSCYIYTGSKSAKEAIENNDYTKLKQMIRNINRWGSTPVSKVPTVAIYARKTKHLIEWGSKAYKTWQGVDERENREEFLKETITMRKFKLKLKRDEENEEEDADALDTKDEYLYLQATIDYLRNISETAFEQIKSTNSLTKVDKTKFRYILTVPAEWTEDERNAMRIMAKQAGIISKDDHENRLLIINESYAATLYCEKEISAISESFIFKEGSQYLVCDAGGGTVDLATYESTAPFTEDDIERNFIARCQLATDSGKKCGSGYVDDRMENLLIKILYRGVSTEEVSMEERKLAIAPLMVKFIDFHKLCFGESEDGEIDDVEFELKDVWRVHKKKMCFEQLENREEIVKFFNDYEDECVGWELPEDADDIYEISYNELSLKPKIICRLVFDPVVNQTVKLIENQLKKANSPMIDAIFLLGGFGKSSYLKKAIKEKFMNKKVGKVINSGIYDEGGETAAMRGAIYYGIDSLRSSQVTSIKTMSFKDREFDPDFYDVLLCFDIGYDFSKCGYFFLKDNKESDVNKKMIDYNNIKWIDIKSMEKYSLGRNNSEPHKIPTVIEYLGDEDDENRHVRWGAEVDPNSSKKTVMNRLLSINKDEFQEFYQKYLTHIYEYACNYVKDVYPQQFNRDKVRYCLTMENCFEFFFSRKEVREIAINASLIRKEDNSKRLLLINREDASSIFYEDSRYTNDESVNSYSWNIRLDGKSNIGTLSLYEVKPYTKKEVKDGSLDTNSEEDEVEKPTLLTEENPIQFEFDFAALLTKNIYSYPKTPGDTGIIRKVNEIKTQTCQNPTHTEQCVQILKKNLIDFFAKNPNLNDDTSKVKHTIWADCCSLSFTIPSFAKNIVKPSIQVLSNLIIDKISNADISKTYNQVDNLNIEGDLMSNVPFLEVDPKQQNDIGTMLKVCLYKSDRSVVKYFEDIRIIDCKQQNNSHHISNKQSIVSQISNDSILKMQGKDVISKKKKAYLNHFLQVQILKDCVYLTLHEATTISGKNYCNANRNIRKLRSTTLEFNFISSLLKQLHKYSINQESKKISVCSTHEKRSEAYKKALLYGLLDYMKNRINLEDNTDFSGNSNQIQHSNGDCCSFKISPHDFITQVLKPTMKDVMDEIYMHILQADMTRQYTLDNIVILGQFVEAKKDLEDLIKDIMYKKFLDLGLCVKKEDIIECTESEGNEVIYGAAIHGLDPTIHTQRISRRTYAVSVTAYNNMDEKVKVKLYHQPNSGSSRTTEISDEIMPFVLIRKDEKVTADMHTTGIFKRFFAKENCIAYAVIYGTEGASREEGYKKIHQFEIALNNQNEKGSNFEIRLVFPNNNETRFEANIIGSTNQREIPEFRFRDQILVTNFYD